MVFVRDEHVDERSGARSLSFRAWLERPLDKVDKNRTEFCSDRPLPFRAIFPPFHPPLPFFCLMNIF